GKGYRDRRAARIPHGHRRRAARPHGASRELGGVVTYSYSLIDRRPNARGGKERRHRAGQVARALRPGGQGWQGRARLAVARSSTSLVPISRTKRLGEPGRTRADGQRPAGGTGRLA